jgi:hypothetical protein
MTNDRIKERERNRGREKGKRKISKGHAIAVQNRKRQERDWIKDRKTKRRKTE